jgi:hypothetical protein
MCNIFILQLQEGKYYIGKYDDPLIRIGAHQNGLGSLWVKNYLPFKEVTILYQCNEEDENEYLKQLIAEFRFSNVRSDTINLDELTSYQIAILIIEAGFTKNKCYRCRKLKHRSINCKEIHSSSTCYTFPCISSPPPVRRISLSRIRRSSNSKNINITINAADNSSLGPLITFRIRCDRCFRYDTHFTRECKATTLNNGKCIRCLRGGHDSSTCKAILDIYDNCTRCGRSLHNSNNCQAKIHINGYKIIDEVCSIM